MVDTQEKMSKETVIDEAERYENSRGPIAFAKGVRWAVKAILPYVQDYWKNKVKRLID
jgi:hypothetical protein